MTQDPFTSSSTRGKRGFSPVSTCPMTCSRLSPWQMSQSNVTTSCLPHAALHTAGQCRGGSACADHPWYKTCNCTSTCSSSQGVPSNKRQANTWREHCGKTVMWKMPQVTVEKEHFSLLLATSNHCLLLRAVHSATHYMGLLAQQRDGEKPASPELLPTKTLWPEVQN